MKTPSTPKRSTQQSSSFLPGRVLKSTLLTLVALTVGSVAQAATLEFDASTVAGYQGGGPFSWVNDTFWTPSGGPGTSLSTWNVGTGTDAVFASTLTSAATVTVSPVSVNSITIDSSNVTIKQGAGSINLGSGGISVLGTGGVVFYDNSIVSGSGGMVLNSTGVSIGYGTQSFTGQVQLLQGSFTIQNVANFGVDSSLGRGTVGTSIILGTVNNLSVTGGWWANQGVGFSSNRTYTLASGGSGAFGVAAGTPNITLSGAIDGGSSTALMAFVPTSTNSFTLSAASTYLGHTRIRENTPGTDTFLSLGINNALPTTTTVELGYTSGTYIGLLDLNGYNQELAGLVKTAGSGAATTDISVLNRSATLSTLTLNIASGTNAYNGTIGHTGGNNVALAKTGAGTLSLSNASTYAGGTTLTAGTLLLSNNNAAGTAGVTISGSSSSTLQIASGITITNNITFSSTNATSSVNRLVANNAAYTTGTSGSLASAFTGGNPDTTASLLAGTNTQGSTVTLAMKFADTSVATNDGMRISDVFTLNGTATNAFVLQLNVTGLTSSSFLGWVNGSNSWVNAVTGNAGNNASGAQQGYLGSFSAFQGLYGATLSNYIGAYGVDTSGGSTWAVLNHNSDFAVVPEPSTWILLAVAGTFFMVMRRRKSGPLF